MHGEAKSAFEPQRLAVLFYFGDLQYWKMPQIAADALEQGFDGNALRRLAGIANPVESEIPQAEIDAAFREMGVIAPIPRQEARLILAAESARRATSGVSNVFDEATHIRIHLCELKDPPDELRRIVDLSKEAKVAPRDKWELLEHELRHAMSEFVSRRT